MPKKWKTELPPKPREVQRPSDVIETDLFAAEEGEATMQTDLHGLRLDEARVEIERFVNAAFMAGQRAARIVHGRGGGALRLETHRLLDAYKKRGLVIAYRDAQHPNLLGGATVFALAPRE